MYTNVKKRLANLLKLQNLMKLYRKKKGGWDWGRGCVGYPAPSKSANELCTLFKNQI